MSAKRLTHLDDEALGEAVHDLDIAWPAPPDITDAVLDEIARGRPRVGGLGRRARIVLLIAAAILALAAAAAAARFVVDLGAIRIEPTPIAGGPVPSSPVPLAELGVPVTLDVARASVGFPVDVPEHLGSPDAVWLIETETSFEPPRGSVAVAMAWEASASLPRIPGTPYGATLIVLGGDVDVAVKLVAGRITPVPGRDAFWVTGPHELDLLVGGELRRFRVDGNVLLWQADDTAYRFESMVPRHTAVVIALDEGT